MAGDWSELPRDLLISITKLLFSLEDFVAFGAVCKSWRSAATKENFEMNSRRQQLLPWLMLCERNSDFAKFYSLSRQKTYDLPLPHQACTTAWWMYSSLGWILTIEKRDINLFHPLSGTRIQLPGENIIYWCVREFVLSASPSSDSDYVVVLLYSDRQYVSDPGFYNAVFWKPGNSTWTTIVRTEKDDIFLKDVVHYKGRFYAVDHELRVVVLNIETDSVIKKAVSVAVQNIPEDIKLMIADQEKFYPRMYLVESAGSLLVVYITLSRCLSGYRASEIRVLEVVLSDGTLSLVKSLGDRALFLGHRSSSFSVKASDYIGCEANSIYLADNSPEWWNFFTSSDHGIFHLRRREIDDLHRSTARNRVRFLPLWVQPTFR